MAETFDRYDPLLAPLEVSAKSLMRTRVQMLDLPLRMNMHERRVISADEMREIEMYIDVMRQIVLEHVHKNIEVIATAPHTIPFLVALRGVLGASFSNWSKALDLFQILSHVQTCGNQPVFSGIAQNYPDFLNLEGSELHRIDFNSSTVTFTDAYRIHVFLSTFYFPNLPGFLLPPPLFRPINRHTLTADTIAHLEGTWVGYYVDARIIFGAVDGKMSFTLTFMSEEEEPHYEDGKAVLVKHFKGEGRDTVSPFAMRGRVEVETGRFVTLKDYQSHSWNYVGFLTEFGMLGSWGGGTFWCWREG
ncbi:hypothetical protein HDU67_006246 [Dinochytrium kinnereticum]|nr:hypothetical protein HDU67_006246 [Dinochytrium kinnereticum]